MCGTWRKELKMPDSVIIVEINFAQSNKSFSSKQKRETYFSRLFQKHSSADDNSVLGGFKLQQLSNYMEALLGLVSGNVIKP